MKTLGLYLLKAFSFFYYCLPKFLQVAWGSSLGYLWFDILRVRRDVIDSNLQIAFPSWNKEQRRKVGRASCISMGRSFMEYFLLPHLNTNNFDHYFSVRGWENYEKARAKDKGVLILSLHLGSYDLLSAFLVHKNMPLHLISKEMKLQWLNDLWFGLRKSKGIKFISDRSAKFDIIKALKRKEAVAFVIDQFTGPPIGIETEFFGRKTGTAKGLALFHTWTKAPVIPVYNYRNQDGKLCCVVGEEVKLEVQASRDETVAFMTQKYNTVLEDIIKEHPGQWLWVHKRWKKFKY